MRYQISKIIAVSAIFLLTASCVKQEEKSSHEAVVDVGPFGAYVGKFVSKSQEIGAPVAITDLIIKFGPMTHALEHGYCEMGGGRSPTIVIDEAYWNRVPEGARESLIFHEMGHCVLNRRHILQFTSQGVPVSLMSPYTIDSATYSFNENYYWRELFGAP